MARLSRVFVPTGALDGTGCRTLAGGAARRGPLRAIITLPWFVRIMRGPSVLLLAPGAPRPIWREKRAWPVTGRMSDMPSLVSVMVCGKKEGTTSLSERHVMMRRDLIHRVPNRRRVGVRRGRVTAAVAPPSWSTGSGRLPTSRTSR